MTILVVESRPDPASRTIARALRARGGWSPSPWTVEGEPVERHERLGALLVATDRLHLESEALEPAWQRAGIAPSAVVFLSKHKAASGRPAFTVHPVGNWGEARFGGEPGRASPCAPSLQSELLRALETAARRGGHPAETTFEVTHHGPLLRTPACFLELGSSEAQWTDAAGAEVVVDALLAVLGAPLPKLPVTVGLGGGHYGPRFGELVRSRAVHFGHMIPAHAALAEDAPRLLVEAMQATPGAEGLFLHSNSLSTEQLRAWRAAAAAHNVAWLEPEAWPRRPLDARIPNGSLPHARQ